MKNKLVRMNMPIACCLASGLFAGQVLADWSDKQPYGGYNPRFGDFPPLDIDKKLSTIDNAGNVTKAPPAQANNAPMANRGQPANNPAASNTTQNSPAQGYAPPQGYASQGYAPPQSYASQGNTTQPAQQPAYGSYYPNQNYQQPGMQRYNRGSNFSGPWNNNRSSFSGPWNNNRGSGFSGPWNNNRGSGFSGPWDNNNSNFSMPWGNNNSGFKPWGNGGGFSW